MPERVCPQVGANRHQSPSSSSDEGDWKRGPNAQNPPRFSRGSLQLKAVEELEIQLLLAKVFVSEGDMMHHTLVRKRYPDQVTAAERMSLDEALDQFLQIYLPQAIYANPPILAKDLKRLV